MNLQVAAIETDKPQAVMTDRWEATSCKHKFEKSFEMPPEQFAVPDPALERQDEVKDRKRNCHRRVYIKHKFWLAWPGLE